MDIVMITTIKLLVNGMVVIAVTSPIPTLKKRTSIAHLVTTAKSLMKIVLMSGLMMIFVMTTTTKLLVIGTVVIAVTSPIPTLKKRTSIAHLVTTAKSLNKIVLMFGLVMDIVMITTIKLPVNGMVVIAAVLLFLLLI